MRLEHTQNKIANRSFYKGFTGYANSSERKEFNKATLSPDKTDKRFTKSKPVRIKRVLQSIKNK